MYTANTTLLCYWMFFVLVFLFPFLPSLDNIGALSALTGLDLGCKVAVHLCICGLLS